MIWRHSFRRMDWRGKGTVARLAVGLGSAGQRQRQYPQKVNGFASIPWVHLRKAVSLSAKPLFQCDSQFKCYTTSTHLYRTCISKPLIEFYNHLLANSDSKSKSTTVTGHRAFMHSSLNNLKLNGRGRHYKMQQCMKDGWSS